MDFQSGDRTQNPQVDVEQFRARAVVFHHTTAAINVAEEFGFDATPLRQYATGLLTAMVAAKRKSEPDPLCPMGLITVEGFLVASGVHTQGRAMSVGKRAVALLRREWILENPGRPVEEFVMPRAQPRGSDCAYNGYRADQIPILEQALEESLAAERRLAVQTGTVR